jgi:hypothetical protein
MFIKVTFRVSALLTLFSLLFSACGRGGSSNNHLIGKWEHKEPASGITVILEFTNNKLSFSAEGVNPAETSYLYVDEDTIKVRNPDTGADVETSYSIDGDKLTIAFSGEAKVEFIRVK